MVKVHGCVHIRGGVVVMYMHQYAQVSVRVYIQPASLLAQSLSAHCVT